VPGVFPAEAASGVGLILTAASPEQPGGYRDGCRVVGLADLPPAFPIQTGSVSAQRRSGRQEGRSACLRRILAQCVFTLYQENLNLTQQILSAYGLHQQ
jgi:hypothetical protein